MTDVMRPRKGDLYVELRNADTTMRWRIEKRYATPEKRAAIDALMKSTAALLGEIQRSARGVEETR